MGEPGNSAEQRETELERRLALRLLSEVVRSRRGQYLLYVLSLISFGGALLVPAYLFREIAALLFGDARQVSFGWLAALAAASGLLLYLLGYASTFLGERTRLAMEAWLRTRILEKIELQSLSELESSARGDFISRVTQDLTEVEIFIAEDLPSYIRQTAVLVCVGTVMLFHSGWMSVPVFCAALGLAMVIIHQHKKLIPVFREMRTLDSAVVQKVIEGYEGQRTLRSFGAERFFRDQFNIRVDAVRRTGLKAARTYAVGIATGHGLSQWLMVLCLAWYAVLFSQGSLSREDALVYPFFLGLFYSAVQTLSSSVYRWNRFFVEGARVADLVYGQRGKVQSTPIPQMPNTPEPTADRETVLEDLILAIPGGRTVGPLSLKLEIGKMLIVNGPSGSGKSTLLETLAALRSPRSVSGYLPRASHVAFVEQSPYLFSGTLRSNISLGENLSLNQMERVLYALGMGEFVRERRGLDMAICERGSNLSEGERYRIAMARALVRERPILILDEPFAALEGELVDRISHYLSQRKNAQAIVIATHWIPASLQVDRVLELHPKKQERELPFGSPRLFSQPNPVNA